jgi:LacI family transcriptional regulator, galactose operon repressor
MVADDTIRKNRPAVLIGLHHEGYLQQVMEGILAHPAARLRWDVFIPPGEVGLLGWTVYGDFDATITQTWSPEEVTLLEEWAKPTVLVEQDSVLGLPAVRADNRAVGQMAFEHFARRGYTHYAYIGPSTARYGGLREAGFLDAARSDGHNVYCCEDSVYEHGERMPEGWRTTLDGRSLLDLPKPLALFADTSYHGQTLALACRRLGIDVPEQVAILGVDDFPLLCNGCVPPLSAINQGTFQIGYQAAGILEKWLDGEKPTREETTVPPAGLTERQSTNSFAVDDPYVRRALLYIRSHATEEMRIADILRHVPVSRRHLEITFKEKLGRTIYREITNVRIELVKQLLRSTSMPLADIAVRTGFDYPTKMSHAFRRVVGCSPSAYRRTHHEM